MIVDFGATDEVAAFLQGLFGYARPFEAAYAIGFRRDRLIGGVLFNNWNPERRVIEMTAGGEPGWLGRPAIFIAFGYAFGDLRANVVVGRTAIDNVKLRRLCRRMGAEEVIVPHVGVGGAPEAMLVLTWQALRAAQIKERLNGFKS